MCDFLGEFRECSHAIILNVLVEYAVKNGLSLLVKKGLWLGLNF